MCFSTIAIAVRDDAFSQGVADGLTLARSAKAHLAVLVISVTPPVPMSDGLEHRASDWLRKRDEGRARLRSRALEIDGILGQQAISYDVKEIYAELSQLDSVIGRDGLFADLMVLNPTMMLDPSLRDAIVEGALYIAGSPVLVVPRNTVASIEPQNVLIAWDGSKEAMQSVKHARPLLRSAGSVTVAAVDATGFDQQAVHDLISYLEHFQVYARSRMLKSNGRTVKQALDDCAQDIDANMVVMGAYGHTRLRERIFGGVTRSVLEEPRHPTFFSR